MPHGHLDDQLAFGLRIRRALPGSHGGATVAAGTAPGQGVDHTGEPAETKEPEGPRARRRPKPPATLSPSGSSAPSNLSRPSRFPGRRPFRWALGTPEPLRQHSQLAVPTVRDRCAQLSLRLSQGSRLRFPDSAAPAARSDAKCIGGPRRGQPGERAGHTAYAQVDRLRQRVTRC